MDGIGINASDLYNALETFFRPHECTDVFDKVGVQYHNTDKVKKVYTSTFASANVIENVLERQEHDVMIFSHHPVPPKTDENKPYPEIPKDLIWRMQEERINLFSYHIPLDRHNPYSPSYTLAQSLGLISYDTFYKQNGIFMGELCQGKYTDVNSLTVRLELMLGHAVKLYCNGEKVLKNNKVAIMSGCAKNTEIYSFLSEKGINTFITGVTNKDIFWVPSIHEKAEENGVNLIGCTHYSTEKFAPISLVQYFKGLGIPSEFIDELPNLHDM